MSCDPLLVGYFGLASAIAELQHDRLELLNMAS